MLIIFINEFSKLGSKLMLFKIYSLYLNEFRINLAANLDRSPLIHSYGYESAGDRPTLFARLILIFVPFMQYTG
jgi:hypothetical protein